MLVQLIVSWVALTLGLFVADRVLTGMKIEGGVKGTLMVSAIYGLLLFALGGCIEFTLGAISLGLLFLFSFLAKWIAGTILLIVTDKVSKNLKLAGIGTAFAASLIAALVSTAAMWAVAQLVPA